MTRFPVSAPPRRRQALPARPALGMARALRDVKQVARNKNRPVETLAGKAQPCRVGNRHARPPPTKPPSLFYLVRFDSRPACLRSLAGRSVQHIARHNFPATWPSPCIKQRLAVLLAPCCPPNFRAHRASPATRPFSPSRLTVSGQSTYTPVSLLTPTSHIPAARALETFPSCPAVSTSTGASTS